MTHIDHLSVEGFKGIDAVEIDTGSFNVITGRNNSGKTSLLQAIDVAFQPSNVSKFGSNLDSLINHHHSETEIEVSTTDDGRTVTLVEPTENRIPDFLLGAFRKQLHSIWKSIGSREMSTSGGFEEREVKQIIDDELSELIADHVSREQFSEVKSEMLLIMIDGNEFPYLNFGGVVADLFSQVYKDMGKIVDQQLLKDTSPGYQQSLYEFSPHYGFAQGGKFVGDEPAELDAVNFIDFMQLSRTLELSTDDADPVNVDNVGDFIKKKGLVEDLKTFNLDHLVFESDEGEKYSVPFDHMGEGFKTTVGVLWELLDDDRPEDIVLLEEPETHMHPGYVRELIYFLIEVCRTDDVQLFVTTHNNDFLNDLFTENLTEDERKFLESEFRLVQLQDGGADTMTYSEAEAQLKDLKLDLRGL